MIPVTHPRQISGDLLLRRAEITQLEKTPRLKASLGAVTLKPSIEAYEFIGEEPQTQRPRLGRNVEERHVVVGSSACQPILEMLRFKTPSSSNRDKRALGQMAK